MEQEKTATKAAGDVEELHSLLLEMGNGVDSLLSESVVALLEGDTEMMRDARKEDVRAHNCWLKVDEHCRHMLCNDELDPDGVEKVTSALKMALDMRRLADEACSAASAAERMSPEALEKTELRELVPHMAELAQDMLDEALNALTTRRPEQTSGQQDTYRELEDASRRVFTAVTGGMQERAIDTEQGGEVLLVGRSLERIGGYVLDITNHVDHYYESHESRRTGGEEE